MRNTSLLTFVNKHDCSAAATFAPILLTQVVRSMLQTLEATGYACNCLRLFTAKNHRSQIHFDHLCFLCLSHTKTMVSQKEKQ